MPKKTKTTGKTRLDKFYHLAKEQGYRSRAAFKLVQLNKKYDFLRSSHALIDLCAAPGGWLQVASKFMPAGSKIIGVDLDPIRAIPHVISMQQDITTPACRAALKKALAPAKFADVVLNDGSPNVGGAWAKEAYTQSELVLHSAKIASEMLRPGGTFISKVFRSQDYNNLLWVLRQLFSTVSVTKPEASRSTSAEIYFVCQGYKAPKTIDPRLFNPSCVFKGVDTKVTFDPEENTETKILTISNVDKYEQQRKRTREGYEDGVMLLHQKYPVWKFIETDAPINILAEFNELVFDEKSNIFLEHSSTTDEVKMLCKDLKVLGKSDMRLMLKWKKKMEELIEKENVEQPQREKTPEELEAIENARIQKNLEKMKKRELVREKKLRRKRREQRAKAQEINVVAGEADEQQHEEMFNLKYVKTKEVLEHLHNDNMALVSSDDEDEEEEEESLSETEKYLVEDELRLDALEEEMDAMFADYKERRKEADRRARRKARQLGIVTEEGEEEVGSADDEEEVFVSSDEDIEADVVEEKHPLQVKLIPEQTPAETADLWFERDLLKNLDKQITGSEFGLPREKGITFGPALPPSLLKKRKLSDLHQDDVEEEEAADDASQQKKQGSKKKSGEEFEEVPQEDFGELSEDSDAVAETLALGTAMLRKKRREQIMNNGYNRWAFNDDDAELPEWFADDQKKFSHGIKPVTKAEVDAFKAQLKEINARPIKKIAEAKARKKLRAVQRWEKVKNQVENIANSEDLSPNEKFRRLEKLYKMKKGRKEKKEKLYAVSRKSGGTSNVERKKGARIVRVDPRMKKDKRGDKAADGRRKKSIKRRKMK